MEPTWEYTRSKPLPRWGRLSAASALALPLATAIGLMTEPRVGLMLGLLPAFGTMLAGLSYWAARFAEGGWLTRARRLRVHRGAQNYRGTQAVQLRVDGRRRVATRVYVNTSERPGTNLRGVYTVLVDTADGLVEVDAFGDEAAATQLATSLQPRLGVDVAHVFAGPAHGGESTFDGLLTWAALSAPVMGFLPMLLLVANPAWVPSLTFLAFGATCSLLELRVRTSSSTTAEGQFRARLEPARRGVRVEAQESAVGDPATLEPPGHQTRAQRRR